MQSFPPLPDAEDAPNVFDGHLWIREYVEGLPLRFRLETDGSMTFGDADRSFRRWAEPHPYQHAVRYVRESFSADALREAAADPAAYTFFGVATVRRRLEYDYDRLPPFLGTEIHERLEGVHTPDRAEQGFRRLGLEPVAVLEKEVAARHFDPEQYDVPESAYYVGPAAGVVFRNKTGGRAKTRHPALVTDDPEPPEDDAAALATEVVTDRRMDRAIAAAGGDATAETVAERVATMAIHESLGVRADQVNLDAFETAVAREVRKRFR